MAGETPVWDGVLLPASGMWLVPPQLLLGAQGALPGRYGHEVMLKPVPPVTDPQEPPQLPLPHRAKLFSPAWQQQGHASLRPGSPGLSKTNTARPPMLSGRMREGSSLQNEQRVHSIVWLPWRRRIWKEAESCFHSCVVLGQGKASASLV